MIKRLSFLLTFLFCSFMVNVQAQSVVKVRVLEYNGKEAKTPVPNVALQVSGAGTTATNANGECLLRFRMAKAGEKVILNKIDKVGYEIFNTSAVNNWHISEDAPFTIVICKSEMLNSLYDQYMKVTSEHHEQRLIAQESVLNQQKVDGYITSEQFDQRIKQIYEEYDKRFDNIENYIKRFIHIDLNDLNQQEQNIISLVQHGDIDGAINSYDEMNLVNLYKVKSDAVHDLSMADEKMIDRIAKARSDRDSIVASIYNQVALLEMIGGKENYQKAIDLHKNLVSCDTTNFQVLLSYATYADKQNVLEEAERYFKIAANHCPANDLESQLKLHRSMGGFFHKCRKYDEAYQHLSLASQYYDRLQGGNTDAYFTTFIELKIYEGVVLRCLGKLNESKDSYLGALERIEPYYAKDSATYYENKSMLHINLGNVYYNMEQLEQAQVQYQQAVEVLQNSRSVVFKDLRIMAGAQLNSAILFHQLQHSDDALNMLDTVELTVQKASKINPAAMVGFTENVMLSRIEILFEMNRHDEASELLITLMLQMESTAKEYPLVLDRIIEQAKNLAAKFGVSFQ